MPERRGGAGRAFRRLFVFLALAIVFTIAVVIAVVLATSTAHTVIHFRNVTGQNAQTAIHNLQNLIKQYTK